MTISFTCPHCGGAINYDGSDFNIPCPYCGTQLAVPPGTSLKRNWQAWSPSTKFALVVILLVFVVPTCLGLIGSLLGVCAPFLAVVIGIGASLWAGH